MKTKGINLTAIKNAIFALTSSILTEAVFGQLFPEEYFVRFSNGRITIFEVADFSSWVTIASIVLTFIVFWVVFSFLLPLAKSFFLRIHFRNRRNYRKNEIVSAYQGVRKTVKELSINARSNPAQYYVDVCICVNTLYRFLCPKSSIAQRTVVSAFRKKESVRDMDRYITIYDYDVYVNALSILFEESSADLKKQASSNKEYFDFDKEEISKQLECISHVTDSFKNVIQDGA